MKRKGIHVLSAPYFTSTLQEIKNEFNDGFGLLVIPDVEYNGKYLGNIVVTILEKHVKVIPQVVNLGPAKLHMYDEKSKTYVV